MTTWWSTIEYITPFIAVLITAVIVIRRRGHGYLDKPSTEESKSSTVMPLVFMAAVIILFVVAVGWLIVKMIHIQT